MYLIGEFHDEGALIAAIRGLRANGVEPASIDLFSEEPVELPRGVLDRPSRLSLVSVSGAILFGVFATLFIWWAQRNYRLDTGGMPVFSFWATGVITFEMTMFGAILAAFGWFLWESGLIRARDPGAPVPTVDPGSICLRVHCREDDVHEVSDSMRRAGAVHIGRGAS
jgi:hypothetical protein